MKENVLHYLWLHKKIDASQLVTTKGESLQILNFGQYLETAGPDFFNAQIVIGNQKWAGNVEMHVKSSDWYLHHHEKDNAYNNVILHVVWEHDQEVFYSNDVEIPVLELKKSIDVNLLTKIDTLFASKSWINCEKQINMVSNLKLGIWKERLFFERLEEKSKFIHILSKYPKIDYALEASHPVFGPLTHQQWGIFVWRHVDHHLRQFGV